MPDELIVVDEPMIVVPLGPPRVVEKTLDAPTTETTTLGGL